MSEQVQGHGYQGGFFADPVFDFDLRLALGQVTYGGGDVGEVLATVGRIADGDRQSWFAEWSALAARVQAAAEASRDGGHPVSATWAFLRAAQYWGVAQGAVDGLADQSVLLPTFRAHRACWEAFVDGTGERFVRVEVPYEGTTLPGWLLRPDATGRARPTLVMTNGSDGTVSTLWGSGACGALDRGWNAFLYDGPGQQSLLFERGVPFRPDWESVLTPVVDALAARPDVDASRLTASAVSFAGFWLPRALAFEHRFVAAVADPGVVDCSRPWLGRLPPPLLQMIDQGQREAFDGALAHATTTDEQKREFAFRARPFGFTDPFDVFSAVRAYRLGDEVQQIATPLLVLDPDGEHFYPGQPQELYDLLPGPKELARFTAEEGGDRHCEPLARRLVDERTFDFLDRHLPAP